MPQPNFSNQLQSKGSRVRDRVFNGSLVHKALSVLGSGFENALKDLLRLRIEHITYTSPVSKEFYEKIHALRASEIGFAVQALRNAEWADTSRLVLAGTSEGATSVARYAGSEFLGRIIYSWSCEDNYFVERHGTALPPKQSLLNIISSTDPFFSPSNSWLGSVNAKGHCGDAFIDQKSASIVLIAGAPHTLINLPTARHATAGFVRDPFDRASEIGTPRKCVPA